MYVRLAIFLSNDNALSVIVVMGTSRDISIGCDVRVKFYFPGCCYTYFHIDMDVDEKPCLFESNIYAYMHA